MASADLGDDFNCSTCMEIYTDPVRLPCGHNYCQGCIEKTWGWTEGVGEDPSCPEWRRRYKRQTELRRNLTLRNIAEQFCSIHPQYHGTEGRSCSIHKILEYHCCEDRVCVSCGLVGHHKTHKVEPMDEASEKKKKKLRNVREKLTTERGQTEICVQRLQKTRREVKGKAAGETERATALFRDIREQLEALERKVLSEISRQENEILFTLTDLIQQLEIKKDNLSRKIDYIEELCSMADPLTVLQDQESHEDVFVVADKVIPAIGDFDVDLVSETLLTGLAGIVTGVKGKIYEQEITDLLLAIDSACNSLSGDGKSGTFSHTDQCRPQTPVRFQVYPQVLSTRSFYSWRDYWDVEVGESRNWTVGVFYPCIETEWFQSGIGNNNKSWGLYRHCDDSYTVRHHFSEIHLPHVPSCRKIRISLDYEAGHLSFYELSNPVRSLHTFTATFTEPLHAAFR
ncbi:hypothetical protein GDO86_002652, partial [Hymenochirus boettgeri]